MMDRARASEDEYFRNQEADLRHAEAMELLQKARARRTQREGSKVGSPQVALSDGQRGRARSALNRLIVAGCNEALAFAEAARVLRDPVRQRHLRQRVERRSVFRGDLSAAVIALGGQPATGASAWAQALSWGRALRRLVTGPHGGDAYAACVQAAEKSVAAYFVVLDSSLPGDIRFGIEHQYAEVELDRQELRRLRWGASPKKPPAADSPAPGTAES